MPPGGTRRLAGFKLILDRRYLLYYAFPIPGVKGDGFDDKPGAVFDFGVDFADVFADDAEAKELDAADHPDREHRAGPAGDGVAKDFDD